MTVSLRTTNQAIASRRIIAFVCAALWILVLPAGAQEQSADRAAALAQRAVQLLKTKCGNCHGSEKVEGELRLDSRAAVLAGGTSGQAIDLEHIEDSLFMRSITGVDDELQMPPKNPLARDEVQLLREWLTVGALWSDENTLSSMNAASGNVWNDPDNPIRKKFGGERLDLWSLKKPERPAIPQSKSENNAAWVRNPIDAFVVSAWEADGLQPAREAPRRDLLRRAWMDLTGLPPTFEELERFASDAAPDRYERVIDCALSSPEYGIHFARLWLDVVRYSDSNGFDWDEFRPQAWRYRDYVIRSWNSDKPFDVFIAEQLAGDLLQPDPPRDASEQDRLIATGYLRLGPHDNAAPLFNEQDRSRAELMADLTETTAAAFLGQTYSCCRCHDHKTDPFSQQDHYRLRAFFAGVEFADDQPIDLAEDQVAIRKVRSEIDERIAAVDEELKSRGVATDKEDKKSKKEKKEDEATKQLKSKKQELENSKPPFTTGLLMREKEKERPQIFVFYQGDHRSPREAVPAGLPSLLDPRPLLPDDASPSEQQRLRLKLAEWIGSRDNPWTARVIVNRLWQAHFGEGLVATSNDFGITGRAPSNQPLLDWLAVELIESGWSLKHIQRLIVTSSTYRQRTIAGGVESDANGVRVASMRRQLRRLTAEQTRDSVLACSDMLQMRSGGKPVWPELPADVLQANPAFLDDNATKTKGWYPSPPDEQSVRSLFLIQKRTVRVPWMETFDLPENSVSCARRECSIVAPQALALLNNDLMTTASKELASLVREQSPEQSVQSLFRFVLLRNPGAEEETISVKFLQQHSREELARALLNTNEFAFVK